MTISTQTNIVVFTGDGVATNFPFTFPVYDATHFAIYRQVIATGVIDKTYNTSEYTAAGIDDENGGSITIIGAPIEATHRLIIVRLVPYTQPLDVDNEGGFYPDNIEIQLDLLEMQIQQLREQSNRSVKGFIGETFADLPGAAGRENTFIGFNSSGILELFEDTGTATTVDLSNTVRVPSGETIPELGDAAARALKYLRFDAGGDPELATAGGATLSDGDYGSVTVSGSGTVITIDSLAVATAMLAAGAATYAKIQNVSATDKLLGRFTAGAGVIEELTISDFMQGMMDDANAAAVMTTLGFSSFFQTLIDDADAAAFIATLGLSISGISAGSLANPGYIKFPTTALLGADTLIQWGSGTCGADTTATFNYPQTFGTFVLPVVSGGPVNVAKEGDCRLSSSSLTVCTILNSADATGNYQLIAIGDAA